MATVQIHDGGEDVPLTVDEPVDSLRRCVVYSRVMLVMPRVFNQHYYDFVQLSDVL